jgi:beta-phosphoglucomutase-like phosphatase (HAD superfamily)
VVTALDLRRSLLAIASAQEVARPKPAPDVYRLAIERLGAGPEGVVAIEDSATGLAAASAAALRCVAIRTLATRSHDLSAAALVIGSLEELTVPVLASLAAPPR